MIDNFSIGLTHGLMMLAALLLLLRPDLDREDPPKPAPQPDGWRSGDKEKDRA
jgi:hypothetical protein